MEPYKLKIGVWSVNQGLRELVTAFAKVLSAGRVRQVGLTLVDQALSVGGMLMVNVALARTQSKADYGAFALAYSVFTFFLGLHNAVILETFTIYGSGRYQKYFHSYARLLWRSSLLLGLALTAILASAWVLLAYFSPALASRTVLGMVLTCGVLINAAFVRRAFYIRQRPDLAAKFSAVFFFSCLLFLCLAFRMALLSGFSAFVILAGSWIIAGFLVAKHLPGGQASEGFIEIVPVYWSEHWKYSRWVLITAFVYQLTTQGYFWLAAALLSVAEVGNLRALYNMVLPLDQVFAAMSLVVLPVMCARYATQKMAGLTRILKRYGSSWFIVTCGFVALVFFFGTPAMHVLYAGRFDGISSLVLTLAFLPMIVGIGHTTNGALKAAEKPDFVFYAYLLSGATTFFLGIPLVLYFGLRGAVYGMLVSGAAYTIALVSGFFFLLWNRRQALDTHAS